MGTVPGRPNLLGGMGMRSRALLMVVVIAVAFMAFGCAGNKMAQAKLMRMARTPYVEPDYRVAPPDQLNVEVKGYPEYSR